MSNFYREELNEYLAHCEKIGVAPRFHYMKWLKRHYTREQKEWDKFLDTLYKPWYSKVSKE